MDFQENDYYGVRFLDDIHALFPEVLYDTQMFPDESSRLIAWVRFRVRNMMPQAYIRAKNQYDQQFANHARAEYNEWIYRSSRIDIDSNRVETPPPRRRRVYDYFEERQNDTHRSVGRQNDIHRSVGRAGPVANTLMEPLESNLLLTALQELIIPVPRTRILNATSLLNDNILRRFFESIPINPSEEQIASGSTLIAYDSVTDSVICSVCQEHECFEHPNEPWRKLNNCEHHFHKFCIDNWLQRSPFCPVCRNDIREPVTRATHSNQTSESNPTEHSVSNQG